jgi:nucleoside-diphosphate-sugar epimerase
MHVASPYLLNVSKAQVDDKLMRPAVQGTENVLGSVNRTPSVKRVVLTSSLAAIVADIKEHGEEHVIDENDWQSTSSLESLPYYER